MISNKTNNIKGSKNNLEKRNDLWKDKRIWGVKYSKKWL